MNNENICIGCKVGSMNTALALRNGDGIDIRTMKTYIKYRKDLKGNPLPPIIGDEAANMADSIAPLNLGVIENEAGVEQTKLILEAMNIPKHSNMVLAAPAVELLEGKNRLARAVKETCLPLHNRIHVYSECLCSAVYILKDPNTILSSTFFTVNLGSSTTELGCFNEGSVSHLSAHSEFSGDRVDNEIVTRIQNSVGDAMLLKKDIRTMKEQMSLTNPKTFNAPGFKRSGYVEVQVRDEIITPLKIYAENVAEAIKSEIIGNIDPHVSRLVLENPIIISGGMSNIEGLPELIISKLSDSLNYPVQFKSSDGCGHTAPAVGALMLCEEIVKEK